MKIPLKVYLLESLENLKVFVVEGDIIRTPVDINIACLFQKYDFNPEYDRFRFWSTMHSVEDKHFNEIKSPPISPLIPVRLVIRKLDVEKDWMVYGRIWAEGSFQFLSNDDCVSMRFLKDVFKNTPPTMKTSFDIKRRWKSDQGLIHFFTHAMISALDWFFDEDSKAKYPDLYEACLKFIKSISKKETE